MSSFQAFWVERNEDGFQRSVIERQTEDLPAGELLIEVRYSSLNFKDALSATGNPGVTRRFPHTPGIDAAGVVLSSEVSDFSVGDEVIVIGFDLGMNTPGGFAQQIRVPAAWAVPTPKGLDAHSSMLLGTAGFTAAECVDKLQQTGLQTASGPVLVTGASGGVGSVAVKLLSQLGHEVVAVSGKPEQYDWLKQLGATEILSREAAAEGAERPLLEERWAGVVDTVGGDILFNAVKGLRYGASLAACGLVSSPQIPTASVLPFILRHVNLLGVDSVQLPIAEKARIWQRLATEWQMDLSVLEQSLTLADISPAIDKILAGGMVGRGVVSLAG